MKRNESGTFANVVHSRRPDRWLATLVIIDRDAIADLVERDPRYLRKRISYWFLCIRLHAREPADLDHANIVVPQCTTSGPAMAATSQA